jgi:hypothetical protein
VPLPSDTLLPSSTLYPGGDDAAQIVVPNLTGGRFVMIATDKFGKAYGEVFNAKSRSFTPRPLKGLGTAALTLRPENELIPYFADGDKTRLQVWERLASGQFALRFVGPVTSFDGTWQGDDNSVQIGFTTGGYFLDGRHLGKSRAGYSKFSASSPGDRGLIVFDGLDQLNAEAFTEVLKGSRTATDPTTFTYVSGAIFKPYLELIDDLCGPEDGPDWEIAPVLPSVYNRYAIGQLNIALAIGATQDHAVWEYGTGQSNVKGWRWGIDPKIVANDVFHLPNGYPDNTAGDYVHQVNQASLDDRGRREAIVSSDISNLGLRQELVNEHAAVRGVPREIITFDPALDVTGSLRYRVDYKEGDVVHFHAVQSSSVMDPTGAFAAAIRQTHLVDALFRIRAVTFNLDDEGNATPSFTLTKEGE